MNIVIYASFAMRHKITHSIYFYVCAYI